MRAFTLGRTFDAVLVDDAISYMATPADFRAALDAAARHLRPGGVMVVAPDDTQERFLQNHTVATPAAGSRGGARVDVVFVENYYDPDPADDRYEGTMLYLIREGGRLRVEVDHHVLGLFSLDAWRATLREIGFEIHEATYAERGTEFVTFACLKPLRETGQRRDGGRRTT
jgi:SAM-dependent methyltransferase